MIALLIILSFLGLCLCAFLIWFFVTRARGVCPFCAMKKIFIPRKITIHPSDFEDYAAPVQKPVMGWSSWNTFRQNINEELILETARAMELSGLAAAGYEYINLDDCWQSSLRDESGKLQGDFSNFPSGIPALIARLNARGLKAGLYTSNGSLTCEDLPASLGREATDAATIAQWGAEFFKYDFCHNSPDSGFTPPIEALDFSAPGEKPFACLGAADARYSGMARSIADAKLPAGNAIGFLSYGPGKASFTLHCEKAGEYVLTVRYRKLRSRKNPYLLVRINGKIFEVFFPATKAPSPTGRAQAIVELQAGENEIELSNPIRNRSDAAFLQYARMGRALQTATRGKKPIVFSICEWGFHRPYLWGKKAGNMWRTTPDIFARWVSIRAIYAHTIKLWRYASPGHYNDPDMLEVGNGTLSDEENKAHFSLWCMMAAPLVLGNDIRRFVKPDGTADTDNRTLQIVTNKALIAIDGDPLAKPAKRIKRGAVDVIARPLEGGDIALCFFNKYGGEKAARFDLNRLIDDAYFDLQQSSTFHSHELWTGEESTGHMLRVRVPRHGVKVFRIRTHSAL